MTETNRAATAAAVRALRKAGRLGPEHQALIRLADSTAAALDAALADGPGYVVASLCREHRVAVKELLALRARPVPVDDPWDRIAAELSVTPITDNEAGQLNGNSPPI